MKKTLIFITIISMIFMITSCKSDDNHSIQLICADAPEQNRVLSNEQAEYLNSLWSNSKWKSDIVKTLCCFRFESDDLVIWYSDEYGVFRDDINDRHIIVSDEQRDYINSFILEITDP